MDDVFEEDELVEDVEISEGEQARETVDDWAYLVAALRLNRQA